MEITGRASVFLLGLAHACQSDVNGASAQPTRTAVIRQCGTL